MKHSLYYAEEISEGSQPKLESLSRIWGCLMGSKYGITIIMNTMSDKAGIVIPTKNRSDFVIRQLDYYASVGCPHTVYIGDSSEGEHKTKVENALPKYTNLNVVYAHIPKLNNREAIQHLVFMVKEPFVCFIGDDDFQVPRSITKCIEFLKAHPDYATAGGYSVSVRLLGNGAYGTLQRIANYPRPAFEQATARERIVRYFENYYVPIFSVNRTEQMKKNWDIVHTISDTGFSGEILPSALSIVAGKSKTIDCLGFVRQIHDSHFYMPNTFDWITHDHWLPSYRQFLDRMATAVAETDDISHEAAQKYIRQALWLCIDKWLTHEYPQYFPEHKRQHPIVAYARLMRARLVPHIPFLKKAYRAWLQRRTGVKDIHFDVTQKSSKYYEDFQSVLRFTDRSGA